MLLTGRNALHLAFFIALSVQGTPVIADAASKAYRHAHYTQPGVAHVIQCVAFAKADAGILITGNARDWWAKAAGLYARGRQPEVGSVLSFRPNERMPLGHVAVVSGIVDRRTISIDQSHWSSRGITRDILVKDVSEDNDWTAVRVELLGRAGEFGSIYDTHGFIYPRGEDGAPVTQEARATLPATLVASARPRTRRAIAGNAQIEVAEMPRATRGLDLTVDGIASDAPDRGFR